MTNALMEIAQAEGTLTIRETLDQIFDSLEKSAAQAIAEQFQAEGFDIEEYSAVEQRAMLYGEMLNQTQALDFGNVMIRGRIIDTIEAESLHAAHPGQFSNLEEMAAEAGLSVSEYHNIRDLTRIIFPWVQEHLGMMPEQVWNEVGKSNLRELTPVLKRIITGEESRPSVENAYERLMEDMQATLFAAGETDLPEAQIHQRLVGQLIEDGAIMTNNDLRQTIRPERTPSLDAYVFHLPNGEHLLMAPLSDEQEQMVARRMQGYWDPVAMQIDPANPIRPVTAMRRALSAVINSFDLEV